MVSKAYILIQTAMGTSREVRSALQDCEWVEYAERVTGPYDVVGVVLGTCLGEIESMVKEALGPIEGIARVTVCPISTVPESATPLVSVAVG